MREMIKGDYSVFENSYKKNKGVVLISGHISNWELSASSGSVNCGIPLSCIARPQTNNLVNSKVNEYREKFGNEIIKTGANLRLIYERIRQKKIVAFLIDQAPPPEYSYYVNFFGMDVASYSGAAKIALKFDT